MPSDRPEKPIEGGTATHEEPEIPSRDEAKNTVPTTPSITANSGASSDADGASDDRTSQISRLDKSVTATPKGSLRVSKAAVRPRLQGHSTTAVTRADIHGETQIEQSPTTSNSASRAQSRRPSASKTQTPFRQISRFYNNDSDDRASIKSALSATGSWNTAIGAESLVGGLLGSDKTVEWLGQPTHSPQDDQPTEAERRKDQEFESQFASEYVELDDLKAQGNALESLTLAWSLKLKHFFILSSAGKPIWSRHGDDELISNSVGVIQTIISFYEGANDTLKSFTAGDARFCVLSKGHLFLVAVSRMGENDTQLRSQLEALYTQILSTLTLTNIEKMFTNRPSTDLRRPLQGTEKLLSALADGFTRGSPSTLLSALECLRLRKAHRTAINNHFAKFRAQSLLYGLLVTDTGQLVSVLRPKKHSLHPGDLQLIFNMLFEAKGIRAAGGENWIPICLPGFNNTGYVYMYVSFLDVNSEQTAPSTSDQPSESSNGLGAALTPSPTPGKPPPPNPDPTQFCLILISAYPNSFDDLRTMRTSFVSSAIGSASPSTSTTHVSQPNSSLHPLRSALTTPRVSITAIAPGTPLQHFLYKSRPHVQFVMPSPAPHFTSPLSWRRLMSRYAALHAAVHGRGAGRNKVVHVVEREGVGAAWCTGTFEVFAVAARGTAREAVAKGLEMVVRWARREEERAFVVGGAVF